MNFPSSLPAPATLALAALAFAALLATTDPARAQVAGETTRVDTTITESTRVAMGWSVKKTLMGKTIYNETGQKVGKVEDLIISPDRNLSYVIAGAGGFIGIGRHDVAIPITQIQDKSGRLVMVGATKDTIKAMPPFAYADDTGTRDRFVAAADKDIAKGKAKVAELEKQAEGATADVKARLTRRIATLQADLLSTETKVHEMKQAAATRWKEFEAGVNLATARLRKTIDTAAV